MIIYHITSKQDWEKAQTAGDYRSPSLEKEGFIHCSTLEQTRAVGERFYKGVQGLVILWIDSSLLQVECRYEDSHGNGELFPHLFGPLSLGAVVKVTPFTPDENGLFKAPSGIVED